MKKIFLFVLIIIVGSFMVYSGLNYFDSSNKYKDSDVAVNNSEIKNTNGIGGEVINSVPSKDEFVKEALKLQTLAENVEDNQTCKCYKLKDLDYNTKLTGSILVYSVDDLFISNVWISNGYYLLDGVESVVSGNVEETNVTASLYCGEANESIVSTLCSTNY